MKAAEVIINGLYFTDVSGRDVLVEVVRAAAPRVTPSGRSCRRWTVRRVDFGVELPASRTSAALRGPVTRREIDAVAAAVARRTTGATS